MQMQRLRARACRTDSFNFNYGLPLPGPPALLTCISSLYRNYPLKRSSNFSLSSMHLWEGLSSSNQSQSSPQLTAVAFNEFPRLRQKDKKCDTSQLNSFHPQPSRRHRRFSLPLPPPSISAPTEIEIDCLDAQKDGSMSLGRVKSKWRRSNCAHGTR